MQFQVPQFIEVEDKIFGPLTLKQFFYVLACNSRRNIFWNACVLQSQFTTIHKNSRKLCIALHQNKTFSMEKGGWAGNKTDHNSRDRKKDRKPDAETNRIKTKRTRLVAGYTKAAQESIKPCLK